MIADVFHRKLKRAVLDLALDLGVVAFDLDVQIAVGSHDDRGEWHIIKLFGPFADHARKLNTGTLFERRHDRLCDNRKICNSFWWQAAAVHFNGAVHYLRDKIIDDL